MFANIKYLNDHKITYHPTPSSSTTLFRLKVTPGLLMNMYGCKFEGCKEAHLKLSSIESHKRSFKHNEFEIGIKKFDQITGRFITATDAEVSAAIQCQGCTAKCIDEQSLEYHLKENHHLENNSLKGTGKRKANQKAEKPQVKRGREKSKKVSERVVDANLLMECFEQMGAVNNEAPPQ